MSDRDPSAPPSTQDVRGPVMLSATRIMKPGPARVGRLFGDVTLPRTVELPTLAAGATGAVLGLVIGLVFGGLRAALYGATIFGALGVFLVTYSPLEGESMARWLGLTLRSKRQQTKWRGEVVQVSVGICPIDPGVQGPVRIVPGSVDVPPTQYDRRGVRITGSNRNIDEAGATPSWKDGSEAHREAMGGAPPAWAAPAAVVGAGPARPLPQNVDDDPMLAAKRGRLRQAGPVDTVAAGPVPSPTPAPVPPASPSPVVDTAAQAQDTPTDGVRRMRVGKGGGRGKDGGLPTMPDGLGKRR